MAAVAQVQRVETNSGCIYFSRRFVLTAPRTVAIVPRRLPAGRFSAAGRFFLKYRSTACLRSKTNLLFAPGRSLIFALSNQRG